MDLSVFDTRTQAEEGVWMKLTNPKTGDETDVEILVAGTDSDRFQAAQNATMNKRLEAARRAGRPLNTTAEQMERDGIEALVAATLGWRNVIVDGEPLAFSADATRMLYTRFPAIRRQVDRFIADDRNFLRAS